MRRPTKLPPFRASRPRRRLLAALVLAALPAAAKAVPDPDRPARFFLERIAVEGVRRASPEVIVSESLLAEGHSYTEGELRQAVDRVQRLPFVLDAGFSLGRGSRRGHYRLLIEVDEVHAFFFGADLLYTSFDDSLSRHAARRRRHRLAVGRGAALRRPGRLLRRRRRPRRPAARLRALPALRPARAPAPRLQLDLARLH